MNVLVDQLIDGTGWRTASSSWSGGWSSVPGDRVRCDLTSGPRWRAPSTVSSIAGVERWTSSSGCPMLRCRCSRTSSASRPPSKTWSTTPLSAASARARRSRLWC